ncbi:copper chaperone PCu(A)C [Xylella taiwanensis]|nr:copper chaperone PCu(A)C [Xylella taiwanensis]
MRATPPSVSVAAGYMTLQNCGDVPLPLGAVESSVVRHVARHEMCELDGVFHMCMLDQGLKMPPHGQVILRPGSTHVVLMSLGKRCVAGQSIEATLEFEHGVCMPVHIEVRPFSATDVTKVDRHVGPFALNEVAVRQCGSFHVSASQHSLPACVAKTFECLKIALHDDVWIRECGDGVVHAFLTQQVQSWVWGAVGVVANIIRCGAVELVFRVETGHLQHAL